MKTADGEREATMDGVKRFVPESAVIESGRILCPYCRGFIGRAYYGAHSGGVELKCINDRCKKFYRLDL